MFRTIVEAASIMTFALVVVGGLIGMLASVQANAHDSAQAQYSARVASVSGLQ